MATSQVSPGFDVRENSVIPCFPTNAVSVSPNQESASPNCSANSISPSANSLVTTAQLAERYAVSDRSIQLWIKRLIEEGGIDESLLKENRGNQATCTAYCVELLESLNSHRGEGKKIGSWFSSIAHEQAQQAIEEEENSQSSSTDSVVSPASISGSQLAIAAGVVPGEIALATDHQKSMLDSAIERFTPQPTHLNGQQETNLSGIELLIGAVDQATAINDQRESALQDREATVEKSEQALELVRDRLQTEQKRSKQLNQQAAEIGEREQAVSELLGKLGISQ